MQQRTDPQVVLDILQENLKQVVITEPEVTEVESAPMN